MLYARMTICHEGGDAVAALKAAIGKPSAPEAIERSSVLGHAVLNVGDIDYAAETFEYLIAGATREGCQLQIYIERKHGSLREHCATVWYAFRREARRRGLAPRMSDLTLIDQGNLEPVLHGYYGVGPALARPDFRIATGTAVVSLIVLAVILGFGLVEGQTANLWIGAAPAFIVGLVSALVIAFDVRRGLTWKG